MIVTDRPREPGRKRRVRYVPAPPGDVERLVAAAKARPELLDTIIALFDRVMPKGGSGQGLEFHVARLPGYLRRAAQRLLTWSVLPDRELDGPFFARHEMAQERARLLGESPSGERARALIARAKQTLPATVTQAPGATYNCPDLLPQWNGRLVTRGFIDLVIALGATSQSFVLCPADGSPATRPKPDECPLWVFLDYGCVVACVMAEVPRLGVGDPSDPVVYGTLQAWSNFGTEGRHLWVVVGDDGRRRFIERGDHLTIYADPYEKRIEWKGRIWPQPGSGSNWLESGRAQRRVDGYLIPWAQRGVDRTLWTGYFVQRPALRAKVVPKES